VRVGSDVPVAVRVRGTTAKNVGSFTARIAYDSTALRYMDEVVLSDSATRVINPQPGLLRLAGIAPSGFTDGQLYLVRFALLRPAGLSSLRLTVDELHTTARADALTSLVSKQP